MRRVKRGGFPGGVRLVAALCCLALAACARVGELPGGEPDREPPHLISVVPPDSTTSIRLQPAFELLFDEPLSSAAARRAVHITPNVRTEVKAAGRRLHIQVLEALPPDTLVVVTITKQLQDAPQRDNKITREIVLTYSTGPKLRGAALFGRVFIKGKTDKRAAVVWEPVQRDTTHTARPVVGPVAGVDAEGLFRLGGIPPLVPFRLRAFLDANDNLRADESELAAVWPDTFRLALGEVRRGLALDVTDPKEPATLVGVAVNSTRLRGSLAVALRRLMPALDDSALADTTRSDPRRGNTRPIARRDTSAWAPAYARLDPRHVPRGAWQLVYASPRGDYSVRVAPGRVALVAFVDVQRDSLPGVYARADSSGFDWEPLVLGDTLDVLPGAKLRPRALDVR